MEENKSKVFQGTGCSKQCHSVRHSRRLVQRRL
jgi:hypothetical protein